MSTHFSPALRTARAEQIIGKLDAAATPGRIEVYATTQPSPGAEGGTPLATIVLQKPCGTAANGVLAFAITPPAQVATSGTILWARGKDGNGNWVLDGNVAVTGTPGATFTMDSVSVFAGAFLFLFGATFTEPV